MDGKPSKQINQGSFFKAIASLFRDRQIYHRSNGIVRFVKLSSKTQIALTFVLSSALLWMAYASVNVVFKEQIIIAKDSNHRSTVRAYTELIRASESKLEFEDARRRQIITRLLEYCADNNCQPSELEYILRGNNPSGATLYCSEEIPYSVVCDDVITYTPPEKPSVPVERAVFRQLSSAVLRVSEHLTGEEVDLSDPEAMRDIQIWVLQIIFAFISTLVVAIVMFVRRKGRLATASDIEELKQAVLSQSDDGLDQK